MTPKQRAFVSEYLKDFNATQAAIRAGYSEKTARSQGQRLLTNVDISAEIEQELAERTMQADEVLTRLTKQARFDMSPYVEGYGRMSAIRTDKMIADGHGDMIREIWQTAEGVRVKIASPDDALDKIAKVRGMYVNRQEITGADGGPIPVQIIEIVNPDDSDQ